ncbi:hypothetical protein IQ244_29240 [Nostoc sp. LEGE 06077]|uniref:hypothetical protein n=1 Tax=Nostoc sp. LEGE 06077 TaxID=915325 RepID=UPI0018814FEC|nr:hypothetical protein [Nostoc sp. LEGE 06077]MBE9210227.1 hypothetical protein [Nostoc sp. LEGE 06077]MBE9210515.1 hypothetical protein [Nostoc sp. LEGE 06077]
MGRPRTNHVRLTLSEDEMTVELTVRTSSRERAIEFYEKIEQALIELMRLDLEVDWQQDNPDQS